MITNRRDVLEDLQYEQPRFALLDAARDPRIVPLLQRSAAECQSLYKGWAAEQLSDFAPYLVSLDSSKGLLSQLVEQGWGDSWAIYVCSQENFAVVRHHLRRFLMVKLPDGQQVYFRFYDPRVLRVFVRTLNADERATFFGPIKCFVLEDDDCSHLLVLRHDLEGDLRRQS